jgi:hypothetical protein
LAWPLIQKYYGNLQLFTTRTLVTDHSVVLAPGNTNIHAINRLGKYLLIAKLRLSGFFE